MLQIYLFPMIGQQTQSYENRSYKFRYLKRGYCVMYKLTEGSIQKSADGSTMSIPKDPANRHYQEFVADVKEHGLSIVEGEYVIEPSYVELRSAEYPDLTTQLDMQYWDSVNGTTTWKDAVDAVKAKYPKTITGGTTVAKLPQWVVELA